MMVTDSGQLLAALSTRFDPIVQTAIREIDPWGPINQTRHEDHTTWESPIVVIELGGYNKGFIFNVRVNSETLNPETTVGYAHFVIKAALAGTNKKVVFDQDIGWLRPIAAV